MSRRNVKLFICSRCHKEKPFYCKNMCSSCYRYVRRRNIIGICTICNRERPEIDGKGWCNVCRMNDYRARKGRKYLDKHAARERARRERLGEVLRQKDRERHQRDRDRRIARSREYYARNPERWREYQRQYRKANPRRCDMLKRRYQLRKLQLPSTLTLIEWEAIKAGFNQCCVYCNQHSERLTQEHIIPVSKGGAYTADNIVSACPSCNSRKHTQDAFEFLLRSHAVSTTP